MATRQTPCAQRLAALTSRIIPAVLLGPGVCGTTVHGATIFIDPGQSIQAVINDPATVDGDVLVVMPGLYPGQLDFAGKAITLQSSAPLDPQTVAETIIDAAGAGTVISCATGEGPGTVLDGFTITGGDAAGGGGMSIVSASPTIRNCVFIDNYAIFEGGGILADFFSSPVIVNCSFLGNTGSYGGGVANIMSSPEIVNCVFSGNTAYNGGSGGAIDNFSMSDALIASCTFYANTASYGGAVANTSSSPTISNCAFFGSTSLISGDEMANFGALPLVSFCCIPGSGGSAAWDPNLGADGGGNLDADPLFTDALGPDGVAGTMDDDLRLLPESPCLDAGGNDDVPADSADLDGDGDYAEATPLDLDGYERFLDDPAVPDTGAGFAPLVDMGAYEREGEGGGGGGGGGGGAIDPPLDIRPGQCPNKLNRRSNGHITVALAGSADFDLEQIDQSTLRLERADGVGEPVAPRLGPNGPAPVFEDVTAPAAIPGECEVLDPDGVLDLVLKFRIRKLVNKLELNDVPRNSYVDLIITGTLLDGTPFFGEDSVKVTNRPRQSGRKK